MTSGQVGLAIGAGMVAAVNPCGFALLPAYLSLFVLDDDRPARAAAVLRALRATAALTAGFAAVFLVFGLVVAPVAASVQRFLPGFTILLGLAVAVAGVWVLLGHRLPALQLHRRAGAGQAVTASWPSMTGFGASYALASLGCTIAPFLAVVVTAFQSGSIRSGLVLFVAYATGMGVVVGAAAVATALARGGLIDTIRDAGTALPRIGGLLLVLAGGYVGWYGIWEWRVLHKDAGTDRLVANAEAVQQWLADLVGAVGVLGFVAILFVLVGLALIPRRAIVPRGARQ